MHEKVCSRARCRPRSSTSTLVRPANGVSTASGRSRARLAKRGQAVEELRPAVSERVSLERAERDDAEVVERAPDARLGQEQEVASREVHGTVRRVLVGNLRSRHAPVCAVHVGDRELQRDQWPGPAVRRQRVEEPAEMLLLDRFPGETEADVDRLHDLAPTALLGHEDCAVDPAAGQHGDPTGAFSGTAHSPRYTQPDVHVSRTTTWDSSGRAGLQALPDPAGQQLAGRVLQPLDLVQVVVVELVEHRPHRSLRSAKSRTQPDCSSTGPSMCTPTRNECPCSRAHLCPGSTFGSRWAASKVNSLKISTRSLGFVHLGRPFRIIGKRPVTPGCRSAMPAGQLSRQRKRRALGPCLTCGLSAWRSPGPGEHFGCTCRLVVRSS